MVETASSMLPLGTAMPPFILPDTDRRGPHLELVARAPGASGTVDSRQE